MTGKKYIVFLMQVLLVLVFPATSQAQLIINEIQYNPEGSDGGYEWIELYNDSNGSVSIQGWILRESDKNHRLEQTNEDLGWSLPSLGYAVIADNPTKFLEKHPGFPGLLFDSSFTLVNTGGLLEMLNENDELIFGIEYNPEWGGNGDGSTLGIFNNNWISTNPTPGYKNELFDISEPPSENIPESTNEPLLTSHPESIDIPGTYIKLQDPEYKQKTIKADAGPDKTLLLGVPFLFSGTGYGLAGGILEDPVYIWNFGDGTKATGREVLHTYLGPGTYTGTLKVISNAYTHVDHFTAQVITPNINITASEQDQLVYIANKSPHVIELSNFFLQHESSRFMFPEDSFIAGNSQITLSAKHIEMDIADVHPLVLHAPDGYELTRFHGLVEQIKQQISLSEPPEKLSTPQGPTVATSSSDTAQIVYVGVPQYIEAPSEPQDVLPTKNLPVRQTASLPEIKKSYVSPFEITIVIAVLLFSSFMGIIEFRKYRKREEDTQDIKITEL